MENVVETKTPNRLGFFKSSKTIREVFYDIDEFLKHIDVRSRVHYEILRESFDAGGLNGIRIYCILSAKAREGHIAKYEEIHIIDPFTLDDGSKNLLDLMKEKCAKIVEEFVKKAKEIGATPGRWC